MDRFADLERVQTLILQRIEKLELSLLLPQELDVKGGSDVGRNVLTTEEFLSGILRSQGVSDFCFKRVPKDYYDWSLDSRKDVLDASSVDHLCKSIVMVSNYNAIFVIHLCCFFFMMFCCFLFI